MMKDEEAFPRLAHLSTEIMTKIMKTTTNTTAMHYLLLQQCLELMYEMARIQKLSWDDLGMFWSKC